MTFGDRLKDERQRLGLTQPDFAAMAGTTKKTMIDWEKNKTSPDGTQLAALSGSGVDVLYIVTGRREFTEQNLLEIVEEAADLLSLKVDATQFAKAVFKLHARRTPATQPISGKPRSQGTYGNGNVVVGGEGNVAAGNGGIAVGGNLELTKIIQSFGDSLEAARQKDFEKVTGIKCDKFAREKLDELMRQGFTWEEISAVWKARSLRWNSKTRALSVIFPPGEKELGIFMSWTPMIFWTGHTIYTVQAHGILGVALSCGLSLPICLVAANWGHRVAVKPREIATNLVERTNLTVEPFVSPFQRLKNWIKARLQK